MHVFTNEYYRRNVRCNTNHSMQHTAYSLQKTGYRLKPYLFLSFINDRTQKTNCQGQGAGPAQYQAGP